jgi:hypothetical protein
MESCRLSTSCTPSQSKEPVSPAHLSHHPKGRLRQGCFEEQLVKVPGSHAARRTHLRLSGLRPSLNLRSSDGSAWKLHRTTDSPSNSKAGFSARPFLDSCSRASASTRFKALSDGGWKAGRLGAVRAHFQARRLPLLRFLLTIGVAVLFEDPSL